MSQMAVKAWQRSSMWQEKNKLEPGVVIETFWNFKAFLAIFTDG